MSKLNICSLVHFAVDKVEALMKNGVDLLEAINLSAVFLVQAAKVRCKRSATTERQVTLTLISVVRLPFRF